MGNLIVRMDEKTKQDFYRLVRTEGTSASEKVREMIEDYLQKHDISRAVDNLWEKIGTKMKKKGFREKDIPRIVKQVRSGR